MFMRPGLQGSWRERKRATDERRSDGPQGRRDEATVLLRVQPHFCLRFLFRESYEQEYILGDPSKNESLGWELFWNL